jgi:hypothetical protein
MSQPGEKHRWRVASKGGCDSKKKCRLKQYRCYIVYCTVSNPRIFKDEALQVLLLKKIGIDKAIVSLQNTKSFSDEAIQLLLLLLPGGMSGFTD